MPKPFKHTVKIGDQQHEIDVTPPEGYFDSDEVTAQFVPRESVETTVRQRVERAKRDARTAFLDDEEFVQEIAGKHGLQKAGAAPPNLDERLKSARQEWERTALKPLQGEAESLKKSNQRLLRSVMVSDVLTSANEFGVKKSLLKAGPDKTPPIVNMLGGYFDWDPEHGHYAAVQGREEDGTPKFRYSGKPDETGSPHMGVREFLKQWAEDKGNADFLEPTRQIGAQLNEPGGGSGKDIVLTPEQASDHGTYSKAQEQAAKQGGYVVVAEAKT